MLSWISTVPPRSEMMFWILRFTVVRTRSTSWLSVEWRHTLRGRMLDHTRMHCGKMLLMEVRSFLTEASRSVGLSVLRSLPPKCIMRTSGLGQVIFSWWSWVRSWGHVMPWVPFHQMATLLGSMPSCIPTSGDLARDSAQYTREWPHIQTFLGSLLIGLPTKFQQNAFVSHKAWTFPLVDLLDCTLVLRLVSQRSVRLARRLRPVCYRYELQSYTKVKNGLLALPKSAKSRLWKKWMPTELRHLWGQYDELQSLDLCETSYRLLQAPIFTNNSVQNAKYPELNINK